MAQKFDETAPAESKNEGNEKLSEGENHTDTSSETLTPEETKWRKHNEETGIPEKETKDEDDYFLEELDTVEADYQW